MRFDLMGFPRNPYDEVVPGLCQASSALSPSELVDLGFDLHIDVGGWPRSGELGRYVFHLLDDVPWLDDPASIDELGMRAAEAIGDGRRVVVNCAAGLNRSGLVVGRALIERGVRPAEAIRLVRAARGPHALSNVAFARWLLIDCTPRALAARR
jgi:hypothetical protein